MDGYKILIVDDDYIIRELLKVFLRKLKYETEEAADVDEALDILKKEPDNFFLIFSDYSMPKKTGIDLMKSVKKLYPVIEVVMITGVGSEEVAIQALRLGALDYIKKPIDVEVLIPIVNKAKELAQIRRKNIEYFNQVLKVEDKDGEAIGSFKVFMKRMEEELVDKNAYTRKAYFFLKKLDQHNLQPELKEELSLLLDKKEKKTTEKKVKKKKKNLSNK